LAASTPIAWAQFGGLATPFDGSKVFFSSTLRLKGTNQPNYPKLFVADEGGVRLFHALPKVDVQSSGNACVVGSQYSILATQVSADGSIVAGFGEKTFAGNCSVNQYSTDLITPSGEQQIDGMVYRSPNGRYASVGFAVLDLQTGVSTPIPLPTQPIPPHSDNCYFGLPGKPIADNGTVILACSLSGAGGFSLGKLGEAAQPFPVSDGLPYAISAAGSKVLYRKGKGTAIETHLLDLNTQQDQFLAGNNFGVVTMSDDARRILLWSDRPYIIESDGSGLKPLTASPVRSDGSVVLSGNGKFVYYTNAAGELFKIDVDTAESTQVIGRTPYVDPVGYGEAGWVTTVGGKHLSDTVLNATAPLPTSLGNITVHIDQPNRNGRGNDAGVRRIDLPIQQVFDNGLLFLLPWDLQPLRIDAHQPIPITVEVAGVSTPFDFPEVLMHVQTGIGASLVLPNGLPRRGEKFEVRATGLGAVYPEVPLGFAAPAAEPLARIVQPLACISPGHSPQTIPVLYAGLLPGSVYRIYQVILQAPSDFAGVDFIKCSLGSGPYLDWVQVQVLP
jgi:uncharacterized protein (TIGR03437 family)